MWSAKIVESKRNPQSFSVNVLFTDGTTGFNEILSIRSLAELHQGVKGRLDELNKLDAITIPTGDFTPNVTPVTQDLKSATLASLREAQELVALGVLEANDPKVQQAIDAYKAVK